MPSLLEEIKDAFGDKSFYDILNIEKSATKNDIRKAYYQLSLKVHPDRVVKNKTAATKQFQALGKIYDILSDADKRAMYDETGTVDDECSIEQDDRNWYEYWRLLFARVKMEDIEVFEKKYKGSDEELTDLKKAYNDAKGDMDQILDNMMCSTVEDDEPRFRKIIQDWIADKTVKPFAAFTREKTAKRTERKRKADDEAREAEEELKKLNKNNETSLAAMIQRNQKSRSERADDFFAMMEEKYGGSQSRSGSRNSSGSRPVSNGRKKKSPSRAASAESPTKKGAKRSQSSPPESPRDASPAKKAKKSPTKKTTSTKRSKSTPPKSSPAKKSTTKKGSKRLESSPSPSPRSASPKLPAKKINKSPAKKAAAKKSASKSTAKRSNK